ncbi:MAG: MerR family transcriptional regulator [Anaerolineae bacterium]|nr:MerR family transcriptional regulator [Anaerolineae bacterium]
MPETYTIQQTVEEMGVTAHTLRYYEKIGLLHPIGRALNGHRKYTEEDLGWIYWLKLLRDSGMSIQTMHRYVDITRAGEQPGADTLDERCAILEQHRDELRTRIGQLQGYLEKLEKKVAFYRGYEIA